MFNSIEAIQDAFAKHHYIADRALATTVFLANHLNKPNFLEGESGVGKTDVARVIAEATGGKLIRLQLNLCQSLEWIDISQRGDFCHAAKTNLIANESDRALFDTAFNLFWKHPRPDLKTLERRANEDESAPVSESFTDDDKMFNFVRMERC